ISFSLFSSCRFHCPFLLLAIPFISLSPYPLSPSVISLSPFSSFLYLLSSTRYLPFRPALYLPFRPALYLPFHHPFIFFFVMPGLTGHLYPEDICEEDSRSSRE
ncbi:MAG: hypothetical protein ACI395_02980, partial [Candidatus Cryptobacteroides sp.]